MSNSNLVIVRYIRFQILTNLFLFGYCVLITSPIFSQTEIRFNKKYNSRYSLMSADGRTQLEDSIFSPSTKLILKNVKNPEFIVFEYSSNSDATIKISSSNGFQDSLTLTKHSTTIPSKQLSLQIPEIIAITLTVIPATSNVKIESVKIYEMDSAVARNLQLREAIKNYFETKASKDINNSIENLKNITHSTLTNLHEIYHEQNQLLVELKIADFINKRNEMSNPTAYKQFKEMIGRLRIQNTDSVAGELLRNFENKLKERAKPSPTFSSLSSIASGILNTLTGGGFQSIFNGIKTLATNIIGSKTVIKYENNKAIKTSQISQNGFIKKYNDLRKDFRVMNLMLDNLEQDQLSMNGRIETLQRLSSDIKNQQNRLIDFVQEFYKTFNITPDLNKFIETSKLITSDSIKGKLKSEFAIIDSFIQATSIVTNDKDAEVKISRFKMVLAVNSTATIFNSNAYANSAKVYSLFLDFANDLLKEKLISDSEGKGLDSAYVAQVNNQFDEVKKAAIGKYCELMSTIVITLIRPSDFNEKSIAAKEICKNIDWIPKKN
jgi:sulfur relay (sulfurtransferase) DsrC/TusE family protein